MNLLITGVGSLIGQGILKSIQLSRIKARLIGTDYFASAVGLYWVEKGYLLPDILDGKTSDSEWLNRILEIIKKEMIDVVLIGLDFEVELFTKYKSVIEETTNAVVIVSDSGVINICQDKWKTVSFLKANGFLYPASCLREDLDDFLGNNDFPLIVKPRYGSRSEGLFEVKNSEQLKYAIDNCEHPVIQELISSDEEEFTCGSVFLNDEVMSIISLRRTLKDGNTSLAFSENYPEIDDFVSEVTKRLRPYGPVNFQMRITKSGPTIFEINPRFSGTTPIRAMFGVNEVETILDIVIRKIRPNKTVKEYGVVIRYLENQLVPLEEYWEYKGN